MASKKRRHPQTAAASRSHAARAKNGGAGTVNSRKVSGSTFGRSAMNRSMSGNVAMTRSSSVRSASGNVSMTRSSSVRSASGNVSMTRSSSVRSASGNTSMTRTSPVRSQSGRTSMTGTSSTRTALNKSGSGRSRSGSSGIYSKKKRPGSSFGRGSYGSKHRSSSKSVINSSGRSLRLLDNTGSSYDERSYGRRQEPAFKKPKKPKRPKISPIELLRLHKSILILAFTIGMICLLGIAGIQYVRSHYRVKTANVVGNTYYTDEEIQDMVMNGMFAHNSLYLGFKYHNKSIVNIPFIEKITVDIKSADTIDIRVYEKALAGCINYLENYMYFDREGIVVEGSSELLEGVPVVQGLKFDSVVLYQALPVEDKSVFSEILDLTQLLSKYNLSADQMYFDSGYNVYIYFDNVEVAMGSKKNIDEKVIQLPYILPSLEGKKGTLHLEDYDENTESVRFEEAS